MNILGCGYFAHNSTERECCFGAGDCEGPVRPGPVLCVNVPPFLFIFLFFIFGFVVGFLF